MYFYCMVEWLYSVCISFALFAFTLVGEKRWFSIYIIKTASSFICMGSSLLYIISIITSILLIASSIAYIVHLKQQFINIENQVQVIVVGAILEVIILPACAAYLTMFNIIVALKVKAAQAIVNLHHD